MEKLELRQLNKICKDKNIEELNTYLNIKKLKLNFLYELRSNIINIYLKNENHLDYLSWLLYQIDLNIRKNELTNNVIEEKPKKKRKEKK